jgi:hypothetical protein
MPFHGKSAAYYEYILRYSYLHRHVTSSLGKLMNNVRTKGKDIEIDEDELDELVRTNLFKLLIAQFSIRLRVPENNKKNPTPKREMSPRPRKRK